MSQKLTSSKCVCVWVNVTHSEGKTLMEMVRKKPERKIKFQKYKVYKK